MHPHICEAVKINKDVLYYPFSISIVTLHRTPDHNRVYIICKRGLVNEI